MTFKVSASSAEHLRGLWSELGAVLTGRRTFEVADGWGGNHAGDRHLALLHPEHPRPDASRDQEVRRVGSVNRGDWNAERSAARSGADRPAASRASPAGEPLTGRRELQRALAKLGLIDEFQRRASPDRG